MKYRKVKFSWMSINNGVYFSGCKEYVCDRKIGYCFLLIGFIFKLCCGFLSRIGIDLSYLGFILFLGVNCVGCS